MSYEYSEDGLVETAASDVLKELGWKVKTAWHKETFGEKGLLGRENKSEVILKRDLLEALKKYNPSLPESAYNNAIEQIEQKNADKTLGRINKEKYELFKNGIPVQFTNKAGEIEKKKLRVFDFENYENNNFLAVRQLEILGELHNRRPDVIGFVNGIPLVFFEFKAHNIGLRNAYTDNLTDYKDTISHVFNCNAFVILSNGTESKVGTVTSPYKFFLDWKRITEEEEGIVSLDTMLRGTCSKNNLMDIFENFLLFDDSGGDVVKIMAKNHQYIGVNKVIDQAKNIEELQGKLGVFWHTQGSGKSYSMVFICQKIHRKFGGSYTFLIVSDRSELERQLYDTFTGVGATTSKEVVAKSRDHLRDLLKDNHRYVFTLIHKFSIDPKLESQYPLITDRKNIIVISDEAHRTQAGTFARNMRFFGIPNASYLGFTGTPIIKDEEEITKNIFGDYVSIYDFKRAIDDGATLPLKYVNRGEKLDIENPNLDNQIVDYLDNEDLDEEQKAKIVSLFQKDYVVLTSQPRLDAIAKDLVWHFNERGYQGKGMLVTLDKVTAVKMHDLIKKYWSEYVLELKKEIKDSTDLEEEQELKRKLRRVEETEVCVIVSSEQNEIDKFRKLNLDITIHREKMVKRDLEKEFKDEENPFRLTIVCAMWITGFDVPSVSTVYLDKPIRGHTLMQTIARANRVYNDEKENGLIVDYGNVYKQLETAYSIYGEGKKSNNEDDNEENSNKTRPFELLEELSKDLEKAVEETKAYLEELGFNLNTLTGDIKPMEKLSLITKAISCISLNETTLAKFQVMAKNVFRKYYALYPENQVKPFTKEFNAIEAILKKLNETTKPTDITSIIYELQKIVDESIVLNVKEEQSDYLLHEEEVSIDLSKLDFDKLKLAFSKSENKNLAVFDLKRAVELKVNRMIRENPLRLDFYEKYQEIISRYNQGKTLEDTVKAFDSLNDFIQELNLESARAIRENLDEESLAIFDLLRSEKELTNDEIKEVKKISVETLDKLKKEKLEIAKWRESKQITSQIKTIIYDSLQWLPQNIYSDDDVQEKTINLYQHIYTNYSGVNSTYSNFLM
jgi:type I restriction enzyme R subunit